MRCLQCGSKGHFKCRREEESKAIKLSFTVEDNIDEFIESKKSYSQIYGGESSSESEQQSKSERKRDKKKQLKKKEKK